MNYDVVVVGAGISGATIAERYATLLNKKVLVIEKRNHIGGNCYDFYDRAGILVSKYGAHIFHTSHEDVWKYLQKFSAWRPYFHTVLSFVDGILVPVPVNITTINLLFNTHLQSGEEMEKWLSSKITPIKNPKNSEESALSRVGKELYEKLFKNYTLKQWDTPPTELDTSILDRIPVRMSFDNRYFSDKYQAIPRRGYTKIFEKMLKHPNITVKLNTDYFAVKYDIKHYEKLFFTGPIDLYFQKKSEKRLTYRSLRFEFKTFDFPYYQINSVINYPNVPNFTRIVEYKHMYGQIHQKTTISKEFPMWKGEPYYPVLSKENLALYEHFKKQAALESKKGVNFVGRLANFKYFNMDQAFKNALDLFYRLNPNLDKSKNL